ncbi:uncharacterized protein N7473_010010 [Penicillium subrubescens]|uniref:Uncharacterized protein n=1 Tax=Penicillium subrubescens TaxID=1316194 RepID=A0A1Q5U1R5_9EURO|nr:uncharacterized protein N7473_010010 [Penicillium subrubescens]KAJ5883124.1 hypothetical protein N7473_010010 [Penicillium subrubescens]OKP06422.1 hypothetical protein PENSUB_6412 [Penicillium subrubescens]
MHFSKTLASAALLVLPACAAFPVASVEFQSWETCPVGAPALGEPKFKAAVTATPVTCDKATVNRDWSIDNYAFKAYLDTKDALLCSGVTIWNNDDCSGEPVSFLPFDGEPVVQGQCLPDILDPGYVSFRLECFGFPGGPGFTNGPQVSDGGEESDGPEGY